MTMQNLRLYKFGKRRHIWELAHLGRLYLTPAAKYGDPNLAPGAYDPKELVLEQRLPAGVVFEAYDGKTGQSKGELKPIEVGPLIAELDTNYYVFCMSCRYEPGLYAEFHADTCLVIADPDRFINQACKAIMEALPDWAVDAGTVRYRSPSALHTLYPIKQDIYYGKDKAYEHQYEIRIVCTPPKPVIQLEPMLVSIGNLYGYSYLTGIESPNSMIECEHSDSLGSPFKIGEVS